jgi:hypothetical protein
VKLRCLLVVAACALSAGVAHAATVRWGDDRWALALDESSGALVRLARADEPATINWLREAGHWALADWKPDAAPDALGRAGPWGIVETTVTGPLSTPAKVVRVSARAWEITYVSAALTLIVRRELADDGSLQERYTLTNTGRLALDFPVGAISVTAPFFDQYPNAAISLAARCHVHVWPGGHSGWINARRMSGAGPDLGLVMTEGAFDAYSQRGGTINDRGVFLLHPGGLRLASGASASFGWKLFWHSGWNDFFARARQTEGFVQLSAERLVVTAGEDVRLTADTDGSLDGATLTVNGAPFAASFNGRHSEVRIPTREPGELRIELRQGERRTWLAAWVTPAPLDLIARRVRFILRHQQRHAPGDPLDGAFLAYDNATGQQVYAAKPSDHNAGRERVGMGVLLATYLRVCPDETLRAEIRAALDRYVAFVKRELQDDAGRVYGSLGRQHPERLYNFPWVAHLHLALHQATSERAPLLDFVRTCRAYYAAGGAEFYAIGLPIRAGLDALRAAGLEAERAELLALFRRHADHFVSIGTAYPTSEVHYEQSIVAPAVQLLLETHAVTGEPRYLAAAREQLVLLDAFNGRQPDHRLHEAAIRHWDDYWFGQGKLYGDTFPHYWSSLSGGAFALYAELTGETTWRTRAEASLANPLSLFTPEGRASCAYVYPFSSNGRPGRFADAWANDQDWALVHWLENSKHSPLRR